MRHVFADGPAQRIAVLVDADNVQSGEIGFAVAEAARHGTILLKRAFGRLNSLCVHADQLMLYGFTAEVAFPMARTAKNTADLLLAVYALRIAEHRAVEAVALVSSDSDFATIARGLAERSIRVLGFGRSDTPLPLREACASFTLFPEKESGKSPRMRDISEDDRRKLRDTIDRLLGKKGRARAQIVGTHVNRAFAGKYKEHFGVPTLTKLISLIGGYVMEGEGTEKDVVRAGTA